MVVVWWWFGSGLAKVGDGWWWWWLVVVVGCGEVRQQSAVGRPADRRGADAAKRREEVGAGEGIAANLEHAGKAAVVLRA